MNEVTMGPQQIKQGSTALPWVNCNFFSSSHDFYMAIIEALRIAKVQIDIEVYIMDWSPITKLLIEELHLAQQRGVQVRVIIDGIGSYHYIPILEREFFQRKIPLYIFKRVPTFSQLFRFRDWRWSQPLGFFLRTLNRRDHKKVTIVDQTHVFIGSQNWSSVHSEKITTLVPWKDFGVHLESTSREINVSIQSHFDWIWNEESLRKWDKKFKFPPSPYRIYNSRHSRNRNYRELARKLRLAKRRTMIVSPYFLPKRAILRHLIQAVERGVHVAILIPGTSDVPLVKLASLALLEKLRRKGVQIYEYRDRILHSKYLMIDDWAKIGSFNFNHRSLLHDLEIEAVIDDKDGIARIEEEWTNDLTHSQVWRQEFRGLRGILIRALSALAFRLRYFL